MKNYAVIGVGRFGESLALTLADLGHDVMVIDRNEELINKIAPYVTSAIIADVTDPKVYEELGLSNVDVAIVAIGTNLESSVLATASLKEIGVEHVVCKAATVLHAQVLKKVGADEVIIPEHDMGRKVAFNLSSNNIIDFFNLVGDYSIIEIYPPKAWAGKSIAELDVRAKYGVNILGFIKINGDFDGNPMPEVEIEASDKLVLLGTTSDFAKIDKLKEKEKQDKWL